MDRLENLIHAKENLFRRIRDREIKNYQAVCKYNEICQEIYQLRELERDRQTVITVSKNNHD